MKTSIIKTEQEELTITCYTRAISGGWNLYIPGGNIPSTIEGFDNITAGEWYRVRLKNTGNLDKTSPGWIKAWNKEGTAVDITSWAENFSIVLDHGQLTLTIYLRDDAVVEKWYGEDW